MIFVVDESIADGAVNRRSAGCRPRPDPVRRPVGLRRHHFGGVLLDDRRRFGRGAVLDGASGALVVGCGSSADSTAGSFPWSGPDGFDIPAAVLPYDGVCRLGRRSLHELSCPTAQ